jgi:hypothetical protein
MRPDEPTFGITIDFQRGEADPVYVFYSMTEILSAVKALDKILIGAVDPELEPTLVLEDVEASSITSWVKNKIVAIDDAALKEFDFKQQIGKYAVMAKYKIIEYLDKREIKEERERLDALRNDLFKLASETKVRRLGLPDAIPLDQLVRPMDKIQDAKRQLPSGSMLIFRSADGEHVSNISVTKRPSSFLSKSLESSASGEMDMTLLVRKPDFLGDTQWEFRHGRDSIYAHIADEMWLEQFRSGAEPVYPGTALQCSVSYEYKYNARGEVATAKHTIVKVRRVIRPEVLSQGDML